MTDRARVELARQRDVIERMQEQGRDETGGLSGGAIGGISARLDEIAERIRNQLGVAEERNLRALMAVEGRSVHVAVNDALAGHQLATSRREAVQARSCGEDTIAPRNQVGDRFGREAAADPEVVGVADEEPRAAQRRRQERATAVGETEEA